MYNREVETTRSDAGKGCLISFTNDGHLEVLPYKYLGVSADKDVRSTALISSGTTDLLFIANNNGPLQTYSY